MVVMVLAKSGQSILVFLDDGKGYITSVEWVKGLIEGRSPRKFIQMKALPSNTDDNRFAPSPVIGDPMSYKNSNKTEEKQPIGDVDEW